ncbi:5-dehydro-4-deoxy-D-glucuronate isomerase [Puteibacter caeruleilacunae]|nr:5-dehydro-4-deoxy-D-glucuronate isomerase [Puteibacter caeruleilacunae]
MSVKVEERFAIHHEDAKSYDTERLRKEFLIENLFVQGEVTLTYSHYDRLIVGGVCPTNNEIELLPIDQLKAEAFCDRRELGLINVGGTGTIVVDGTSYELNYKEALYVGKGAKEVKFSSADAAAPAKFYLNSAPAHQSFPTKHITLADANVLNLGSLETSNERQINQLIVNQIVETCQLQMGMTELKPGSVWNTMPAHTHSRRMEAYMYFEVPADQGICHFMGQPQETRHIWMKNEQAVLSPPWSIHSAAGTSNYIFIWGMAGENLDYADMDVVAASELK